MKNKLIGVFLILIGLIMLPGAFGDLQTSLANKTPTPINFAAFTSDLPEEGWFKLTGAQLELSDALWVDDAGKIGTIYVPARLAGSALQFDEKANPPIQVLVRVSDETTRPLLEKMQALQTAPDAKGADKAADKAATFFLQNIDKMQVTRPFQGTIASGFDAIDDAEKRAIEAADITLADDFVILQEGATPSVGGRILGCCSVWSCSSAARSCSLKKRNDSRKDAKNSFGRRINPQPTKPPTFVGRSGCCVSEG